MYISPEVKIIASVLKNAPSNKELYWAFHYIPLENLKDMRDMIDYIIGKGEEK